ncbi:MAG: tyrosine-type recombinase/integrase [Reichenbachiella sp.]
MLQQIEIDYLPKYKIDYLVDKSDNIKHKCLVLLQCDAGLRVSEAVSLHLGSFDFKERIITAESLKKREKAKFKRRQIPISKRLYSALANYIPTLKDTDANSWLFPSTTKTKTHISRQQPFRYLLRFKKRHLGFDNLHPHALRHSFATHYLDEGGDIYELQHLLGHEKIEMTLVYTHIPTSTLKRKHSEAFDGKKTRIQRFKERILGKPTEALIHIEPLKNELMIGRDVQMYEMNDKVTRNINLILLGPQGVGKSTMLRNINTGERKVLYIDDTSEMKTTLLNILLHLLETKEKVFELIFGETDRTKLKTKLSRHTMKSLANNICDIVQQQEYVLVIDTVDRIPPRAVDVLDVFRNHFTIITSAREVALNKTSFLWNFETIKVENLPREKSLELINKLSYNMEVEDYEQYKNYIWNKSDGNPRVVFEMVDRFRKEPVISKNVVRGIDHYGSLREIDMSLIVIIGLACMAIFRYIGRETGDTSLTFIGGVAMILLIVSRYFISFTKFKVLK